MHELAVCQAMLTQVEDLAIEHGTTSVDKIVVLVGLLSGVEPALLSRAFSVARCGTIACNAVLEIEIGPLVVSCKSCGQFSEAAISRLTCRHCGDWQVTVSQGEELILKSVEFSSIGSSTNTPPGRSQYV